MCGIVGYIGPREATSILLDGLAKLEYRGYDSAGVAVHHEGATRILRRAGKLAKLVEAARQEPVLGTVGIGHTRWATHGRPSEQNAHPHRSDRITVVHNGIIENHMALRERLMGQGYRFQSETDTEILSHLVEEEIRAGHALPEAVRRALAHVHGSYAVAVLDRADPGVIVGARHASPLVVGLGEGENFLASDIPAILAHTRAMMFLDDGDMAVVSAQGVEVRRIEDDARVERPVKHITWSASAAEKAGFKHFMLKEIHEQPRAVIDTLRGRLSLEENRVRLDETGLTADHIAATRRVLMLACGTSWHACLVAKFWLEEFAGLPVEVDLASEFRYRSGPMGADVLVVAVSQSGETADTLAAIKDARKRGGRVLSVCNVIDASIPRSSDHTLYTHAGPEIGVASTKAFVTQLTALYLLALYMGQVSGRLVGDRLAHLLGELVKVPGLIEKTLEQEAVVKQAAARFKDARDFLFLGRWVNYPIALEGALKLKEISYIHAEGYAAGEMKHGPIALIDERMPVVTVVPKDRVYDKTRSNMQETRARHGTIIAVATEGDTDIGAEAEVVIHIPVMEESQVPMVSVVPLQLLSYYVADMKGTDVDQPRNLAKSVTVE